MAGPRRKQLVNKTARPRNNWPFKEIWVSSSGQLVSNDLSLRRQPTPGMKVRIKVKDDQTLGFTITRLGNQDAGLLWFWSSPISGKKQPAHLSNRRVFSEPLWIFAVASCLYFDYECSDFHRSKNDKIVLYQVIVVPPPFNFNILIWSSSLGHRRWPPVAPQPGLPHPDYVKTRQKPQQESFNVKGVQKNALSESSSCKLTRQRDPPGLLGACKPGLWAWMDCTTAMMILKVHFFGTPCLYVRSFILAESIWRWLAECWMLIDLEDVLQPQKKR